ncbi:MAG: ABC transporter permease subunit [Porticoccaceae bacterium]|nr:ABC transporter permease subunit [Porticoccaceae bacterium]
MEMYRGALPPRWKRPLFQGLLAQLLLALVLTIAFIFFYQNAAVNLQDHHLGFGFDFLFGQASFNLGENLVGFAPGDNFWKALLAGVTNTLLVSVFSIVLASIIGLAVAMARLSSNVLARGLSWIYIEIFRNVPLLLQIIFWYEFYTAFGPSAKQAFSVLDAFFVSNRGVNIPVLENTAGYLMLATFAVTMFAVMLGCRKLERRKARIMRGYAWVFAAVILLYIQFESDIFAISIPVQKGFGFSGGANISPEFIGLALGLTIYTSAFIAEIIRGGILGVDYGQVEAAASIGLGRLHTLRLVVLPQAARIIIPPLGSEYLSLVKNSSLAVAIGYPDIVRVGSVIIAGTGRTIETIAIIMAIYLLISLSISWALNRYYQSIMAKG